MEYSYNFLRGKIVEVCGTNIEFAKQLGISPCTLSLKLHNKLEWTRDDMEKTLIIFNLSEAYIPRLFFVKKVKKDLTNTKVN